jgi:hypothetical protein
MSGVVLLVGACGSNGHAFVQSNSQQPAGLHRRPPSRQALACGVLRLVTLSVALSVFVRLWAQTVRPMSEKDHMPAGIPTMPPADP